MTKAGQNVSYNSVFPLPILNSCDQFIFLFQGQNSSLLCFLFLRLRRLRYRSSRTGNRPLSCAALSRLAIGTLVTALNDKNQIQQG